MFNHQEIIEKYINENLPTGEQIIAKVMCKWEVWPWQNPMGFWGASFYKMCIFVLTNQGFKILTLSQFFKFGKAESFSFEDVKNSNILDFGIRKLLTINLKSGRNISLNLGLILSSLENQNENIAKLVSFFKNYN